MNERNLRIRSKEESADSRRLAVYSTTEPDGTIRNFDAASGQEISLIEMDTQDRLEHFTLLCDAFSSLLPEGFSIQEMDSDFIAIQRPDGSQAGMIIFAIHDDVLRIDTMVSRVPSGGRLLLAETLKRHPHIQKISGLLATDNSKAYKDARNLGKEHDRAIRSTPSYKIRAACGFNGIDQNPSMGELPFYFSSPLPTK